MADDLPQNSARTVDVFDGGSGTGSPAIADADYSSRLDGSALLVTGTFIATTGSRSFFVRGLKPTPDHAGWINAFQLRDRGAPDDEKTTEYSDSSDHEAAPIPL